MNLVLQLDHAGRCVRREASHEHPAANPISTIQRNGGTATEAMMRLPANAPAPAANGGSRNDRSAVVPVTRRQTKYTTVMVPRISVAWSQRNPVGMAINDGGNDDHRPGKAIERLHDCAPFTRAGMRWRTALPDKSRPHSKRQIRDAGLNETATRAVPSVLQSPS